MLRTFGELAGRASRGASKEALARWMMERAPFMGPTYVKIGQFMSVRRDIVGADVARVLGDLRDNVNPIPFAEVLRVVEASGLRDRFEFIDPTPVASASIAQIHRATLVAPPGWPARKRGGPPGSTGDPRGSYEGTQGSSGGSDGDARGSSGDARGSSGDARGSSGDARGSSGDARGASGGTQGSSGDTRGPSRGTRRRSASSRDVIIKIKRPDLDAQVTEDIELLRWLAGVGAAASALVGALGLNVGMPGSPASTASSSTDVDVARAIREFEGFMRSELDFEGEVRNAEAFYELYVDDPRVVVPRVHPSLSTADVITMDYEASESLYDYAGDRRKLAQRIMGTFVSQLLYGIDGGIMHGDPHAGNIGVRADGTLVIYDFGSAVRIDRGYRVRLKLLISTLMTGRPDETVRALENLGVKVNDQELAEAYMAMYYKYVRTIDISVFRPKAVDTTTTAMPFQLDETLLRLGRVFGMLEGICKELDDRFDYFDVMGLFWDAFLLDADFVRYRSVWDTNAHLESWRTMRF
jgi:predicted unusual protein kinase regulating ubiquinone biosynthesis (AarF/ABC1/UbiB family)